MIGAIPELALQGDYEVDAVKASIQKSIADLDRAKRDKNYAERVEEIVANSIGQSWLTLEKGLFVRLTVDLEEFQKASRRALTAIHLLQAKLHEQSWAM